MDDGVVQEFFSSLTSTSPNALLLASLDAARMHYATVGSTDLLPAAVQSATQLRQSLRPHSQFVQLLEESESVRAKQLQHDPLRLSLRYSDLLGPDSAAVDEFMAESKALLAADPMITADGADGAAAAVIT